MHLCLELFSPDRIPVSFFWVLGILWIRPIKRLSSSWIITIVLISGTVPISSLQTFNPITGILLTWQIIMENGTIEITSVNAFWITLNLGINDKGYHVGKYNYLQRISIPTALWTDISLLASI